MVGTSLVSQMSYHTKETKSLIDTFPDSELLFGLGKQ